MNKKIGYIFTLIVLSLFVISACDQQAVGRRIVDKGVQQKIVEDDGIGSIQVDDGGVGQEIKTISLSDIESGRATFTSCDFNSCDESFGAGGGGVSCSGSVNCNSDRGTHTLNCVAMRIHTGFGFDWGCGAECGDGYTIDGTCSAPEDSGDNS
jgi:hypothetical protein|tara:strand:- start:1111 stop:1569 length:459 start_codon:yes stop_codon:yes gene_type:complete